MTNKQERALELVLNIIVASCTKKFKCSIL